MISYNLKVVSFHLWFKTANLLNSGKPSYILFNKIEKF